jgi:catechol 2,3-dioxygenase-like lactoylglutathione lyase family enzyme
MKLEVIVIPVSDVDRAKEFYGRLGWRLDADFAAGDDWRVVQFTPSGSGCSVIFGKNVTPAAAGSTQGLYLIVSDIEAASKELLGRGVKLSEVFHGALRRAEAAHGQQEKRTEQRNENGPDWYAAHMVAEQSGKELPQ